MNRGYGFNSQGQSFNFYNPRQGCDSLHPRPSCSGKMSSGKPSNHIKWDENVEEKQRSKGHGHRHHKHHHGDHHGEHHPHCSNRKEHHPKCKGDFTGKEEKKESCCNKDKEKSCTKGDKKSCCDTKGKDKCDCGCACCSGGEAGKKCCDSGDCQCNCSCCTKSTQSTQSEESAPVKKSGCSKKKTEETQQSCPMSGKTASGDKKTCPFSGGDKGKADESIPDKEKGTVIIHKEDNSTSTSGTEGASGIKK